MENTCNHDTAQPASTPSPVAETGRPKDCSGRLETEIRTYDLLDSLNIPYTRVDHEAATKNSRQKSSQSRSAPPDSPSQMMIT